MSRIKDRRKTEARRIVADRVRSYFDGLTRALRDGVQDIWRRVEARLGDAPRQPGQDEKPARE